MSRVGALAVAASLGLSAAPAAAHEPLHEVVRGRAIAVRASFADGEVLAYAAYEVWSPADPKIPWQKGRTDRAGWLAFVPDAPGAWRVKVVDETGHGLDVRIDAGAPGDAEAPAAAPGSTTALVLRPLLGLAVIGAVFAALFLWKRRKGTTP